MSSFGFPLIYIFMSGLWVALYAGLLVGSWFIRRSGSSWPGLLMLQGAAVMVLVGLVDFVFHLAQIFGGSVDWIQRDFAGVTYFQVISLLRFAAYTTFVAGFLMHARAALRCRPGAGRWGDYQPG